MPGPNYIPTPQEIEKEAARIRQEWTDEQEQERRMKPVAFIVQPHSLNLSEFQQDTSHWPALRKRDSLL